MTKYLGRLIGIVISCAVTASAANAYTFKSSEGNFSVEFPAAPKLEKSTKKTEDGAPYNYYEWTVSNKDGQWLVVFAKYSKTMQHNYDHQIQAVVSAVKGTLRSQKTINQNGIQGRDYLIDNIPGDQVLHQRIIWVGKNRMYELIFGCTACTGTSPDVDAFLNSFRTLK